MESKTRTQRMKKLTQSIRYVDNETRQYVISSKIDQLESDFYDSPNRLADDSDNDDFNLEELLEETDQKLKKQKTKKKKVTKRTKKESSLRRNFNLQKLIKEEGLEEKKFPNFVSMRANINKYPFRSFCSICGVVGKYTCPRCGQKYCSLKCHGNHKAYFCLKFDL